jgi:hypothetical protein
MAWAGIVNKAFTASTVGAYLRTLSRPGFVKFIVVHNTGAPNLATYRGYANRANPITDSQWLRNLEGFYRDRQHWSAGPHWFVTPNTDGLLAFTPSTRPGVHSPSWNSKSLGVEMVGDYQVEPFDAGVQANTVALLAELHLWLGLSPDTIRFHHEDPRTTHKDCPGKNVNKDALIAAVKARIADMGMAVPVAAFDAPVDDEPDAGGTPDGPTTPSPRGRGFFGRVRSWVVTSASGLGFTGLGFLTDWQVAVAFFAFLFLMVASSIGFVIWFFGADAVRTWVKEQVL